jgi:integrase
MFREMLIEKTLSPLAELFPKTFGAREGSVDGRPHSLRHYRSSYCANCGEILEKMLMKWLGNTIRAMVRHYHVHNA